MREFLKWLGVVLLLGPIFTLFGYLLFVALSIIFHGIPWFIQLGIGSVVVGFILLVVSERRI